MIFFMKNLYHRIMLARLLGKLGKTLEIPYPDITTKAKAQKFIGLDMEQLYKEKKEFIKTAIPLWDQKAKERENKWGTELK